MENLITTTQFFYLDFLEMEIEFTIRVTQDSFTYCYGSIYGIQKLPLEIELVSWRVLEANEDGNPVTIEGENVKRVGKMLNDWTRRLSEENLEKLISQI